MPNEYRDRAAECFRLARRVNDPLQRALMLEMARAWLRLSDQAEKNAKADLTYETPPQRSSVPQQQQQQQKRSEFRRVGRLELAAVGSGPFAGKGTSTHTSGLSHPRPVSSLLGECPSSRPYRPLVHSPQTALEVAAVTLAELLNRAIKT